MIRYPYRILTGAGLALVVGVVGAQTYGDRPATMPADKNVPQSVQAQPAQPSSSSDQKSADPAVRLPAAKSVTENAAAPAESAPQPTDKMSGQANAPAKASNQEGRKLTSAKATKPTQHATQHATKARGMPEQTAMQGDNAYREALRQCAKEQDQNARDSCLNSAIEQFHRNS